jgi:ATP-binding cassette, subfamily B, multidrug efflux pump
VKRVLVDFLKPYWKWITIVVVLVFGQSVANLYLPNLNASLVNNGVMLGDTGYIFRYGMYMLGVALLVGLTSILSVYMASRVAMGMGRDVRGSLFRKVQSFSQNEINQFGTPSLITRNTNDVQQVQMLIALGLTIMLSAPLTIVGGIIMALREDVPLTATLAVILPVMSLFMFLVLRRALPLFRVMQVRIDKINQLMRETLSGVRVIRAFARYDQEQRRFDDANVELSDTTLSAFRLFAFMMPTLMAIMYLSSVGIMYFGGRRIASGGMQIGNLLAFTTYVMQILISVLMSLMLAAQIPRANASGDRIQKVLEVEPTIHDPVVALEAVGGDGGRPGLLEFKDVEFRYAGAQEPVLSHISFTARPGQTTAVVGSTGSGKTTLISLIPRFYDVTGGSIELDGRDIRDINRDDLWKQIGFVPQKAFLFSGTVESNLRYGDEKANFEEMWHALSIAQAEEFVHEMPHGLDSEITQGGTNVSGGQRQRLAIARAVVKKPAIYVFDDSFSALDFKTDSLLRAALKREVADANVIIVGQRVSSIMHADQIVVLDQGTICGLGTHQELMESCETYREIVYSQLSAEEVA